MNGLRCWPGALAVTTHPARPGMLVEVVQAAPDHGPFTAPDGELMRNTGTPPKWVIQGPGGRLLSLVMATGRVHSEVRYAVCEDRWLRPITPPPGADTTPTTTEREVAA